MYGSDDEFETEWYESVCEFCGKAATNPWAGHAPCDCPMCQTDTDDKPRPTTSHFIMCAIRKRIGADRIVEFINENRDDSFVNVDFALAYAIEVNALDVAEACLQDPSCNPLRRVGTSEKSALYYATRSKTADALRLLIADGRVVDYARHDIVTDAFYEFARNAIERNDINALIDAYTDPSVDFDDDARSNYLAIASRHGHWDIVSWLLDDPRVDPAFDYNTCIQWCARRGNADLVARLMVDGRVNPSEAGDHAVYPYINESHYYMDLAMEMPGDDVVYRPNRALAWALRMGHRDVAKMLLDDVRVVQHLRRNEKLRRECKQLMSFRHNYVLREKPAIPTCASDFIMIG